MLIHINALKRLKNFYEKKYFDRNTYEKLSNEQEERILHASDYFKELEEKHGEDFYLDRLLFIYAIGIEKKSLRDLFTYGEIDEHSYKRILAKLTRQMEQVENESELPEGLGEGEKSYDYKDVFENLALLLRRFFFPRSRKEKVEDRYMYYRALAIISRKVIKETTQQQKMFDIELFEKDRVERILARYRELKENSKEKMEKAAKETPEIINAINESLGRKGIRHY
jgi:hypothetical protein